MNEFEILEKLMAEYYVKLASEDQEDKAYAGRVLDFLQLARVAMSFSPAAHLFKPLRQEVCPGCGKPCAVIQKGFNPIVVDYGTPVKIVSYESGKVISGGLKLLVVENESGIHLGNPVHNCEVDEGTDV